jgi:hypothetical protein
MTPNSAALDHAGTHTDAVPHADHRYHRRHKDRLCDEDVDMSADAPSNALGEQNSQTDILRC